MEGSLQDNSTKKVIVGLTGRVGSSVAAFLLKKQGYQVIGMSIVTNLNDNFEDSKFYPKCHIENLDKINEFCNSLKIPFYAADAKSRFEDEVIDPLLGNKLIGRANSSCFNCTDMRIKVMYEKMLKLKADYIATGHFCKIHKNLDSDEYFVHSNNDPDSDQSYLLSNIDERYLKHLILPLGELRSSEILKISQKFNLKLASENILDNFCFKKKESYSYYIDKRVAKSLIKEGQIYNLDTENYLGDHNGMINHYITEKNLEIKQSNHKADEDVEIIKYEYDRSVISIGSHKHLTFKGTQLVNLTLNQHMDKSKPIECFIKNKYSQKMVKSQLFFKNNSSALIEFEQDLYPVIEGEVFVLFDRDSRNAKVIGRGIVASRGKFEFISRIDEFKKNNEKPGSGQNIFKF